MCLPLSLQASCFAVANELTIYAATCQVVYRAGLVLSAIVSGVIPQFITQPRVLTSHNQNQSNPFPDFRHDLAHLFFSPAGRIFNIRLAVKPFVRSSLHAGCTASCRRRCPCFHHLSSRQLRALCRRRGQAGHKVSSCSP